MEAQLMNRHDAAVLCLGAALLTKPNGHPRVSRIRAIRSSLIFALAAAMTGCGDPRVGTVKADRRVVEELHRANSDRPTSPSKNARKRQDTNDLSSNLGRGEAQP
jgi:hypothetical protein